MLATLGGTPSSATDIDIFLVCDPEEAQAKFRCVFEACRNACRERSQPPQSQYRRTMLVTRTASSVTILTSALPRAPPVQVILHTYANTAQVLTRFDVDCCCMAFDLSNSKLLATPRCLRALAHGVNVMDSKHHSKVCCVFCAACFLICFNMFNVRNRSTANAWKSMPTDTAWPLDFRDSARNL